MKKSPKRKVSLTRDSSDFDYGLMLAGVIDLMETARRAAARAVNSVMTATYWEIGRRVVEFEQQGAARAKYGEALLKQLSEDLTAKFGRGFSERNLEQMRLLYTTWPISQTVSAKFGLAEIAQRFPLPWSHYVRLLSVKTLEAREFYETEALRGG